MYNEINASKIGKDEIPVYLIPPLIGQTATLQKQLLNFNLTKPIKETIASWHAIYIAPYISRPSTDYVLRVVENEIKITQEVIILNFSGKEN